MTPGWPRPVSTLANARSGWPTACEVPPRWARAQLAISTMVLALWITLAVGEGGWLSCLLGRRLHASSGACTPCPWSCATVVVAPPLAPARGPRRPLTRSPVHASQTDTRLVADQARRDRRRGPRRARTRSARRRLRPCYQGARAGPAWWWPDVMVLSAGGGWRRRRSGTRGRLIATRSARATRRWPPRRRGRGRRGPRRVAARPRRPRTPRPRPGRSGAPTTEPGLHQPRARTATSVGTGIAAGVAAGVVGPGCGGGDEPGGGQVGDLPGRAPGESATMAEHAPRRGPPMSRRAPRNRVRYGSTHDDTPHTLWVNGRSGTPGSGIRSRSGRTVR